MKLPRDLSGDELVRLLRRGYGYQLTRQRGSHMRLTTTVRGMEHHVAIPNHRQLHAGTLNSILSDVAEYLGITPSEIRRELFGN